VNSKQKPRRPLRLDIALRGDQRLLENLIFEVREIAKRHGLGNPTVSVERRPSNPPKLKVKSPNTLSKARGKSTI
jgi:hypothetical protein